MASSPEIQVKVTKIFGRSVIENVLDPMIQRWRRVREKACKNGWKSSIDEACMKIDVLQSARKNILGSTLPTDEEMTFVSERKVAESAIKDARARHQHSVEELIRNDLFDVCSNFVRRMFVEGTGDPDHPPRGITADYDEESRLESRARARQVIKIVRMEGNVFNDYQIDLLGELLWAAEGDRAATHVASLKAAPDGVVKVTAEMIEDLERAFGTERNPLRSGTEIGEVQEAVRKLTEHDELPFDEYPRPKRLGGAYEDDEYKDLVEAAETAQELEDLTDEDLVPFQAFRMVLKAVRAQQRVLVRIRERRGRVRKYLPTSVERHLSLACKAKAEAMTALGQRHKLGGRFNPEHGYKCLTKLEECISQLHLAVAEVSLRT